MKLTLDLQASIRNLVQGFPDTADKHTLNGFWWKIAETIGLVDYDGNYNENFKVEHDIELPTEPKSIMIEVKYNYGIETYYPVDTNAKLFASLVGQKTLTPYNIGLIKSLGYVINVKQKELKI